MDDKEIGSKKDFDLEIVYRGFKNCMGEDGTIHLSEYLEAFTELCRFFKLAGRIFGFIARDLDGKISIIRRHMSSKENGDKYSTAQSMLEYEISCKITHRKGRFPSGTRTLLRLQHALEFIINFMKELVQSDDDASVRHIASNVYSRTLSKHHPLIVRKMAAVVMYLLPSRRRLIEVMCKHEPDQVLALTEQVLQVAYPAYDNIQELYKDHDLLYIP